VSVRAFLEYRVVAEKKEEYLRDLAELVQRRAAKGCREYRVAESLDQGLLFVETFLVESKEEYERIEAKLKGDPETRALLERLDSCVEGGAAKKKAWFFADVSFS
jgi:quinol monooxygenase YgiN